MIKENIGSCKEYKSLYKDFKEYLENDEDNEKLFIDYNKTKHAQYFKI